MRQGRGGKGLLQEGHAFVQDALMDDGILGVGGGKKNLGAGLECSDTIGQLFTAHMRHDDIGEQQINVADVSLLLQAQSFDAVGRR